MSDYRILTAGDSAFTIEFGKEIAPEISREVRSFRKQLEEKQIPGVTEYIQTYCTLMVHYDPLVTDYDTLYGILDQELQTRSMTETSGRRQIIEIPVCYGGKYGPDLENVSAHTGLSSDEVIKRHSGTDYQIYMLGFLPGFAYLGGMDPKLATPRLKSPRERLEAGAVGIAGSQTGIYPLVSPGGWQIIGQTPVKPYDPDRQVPILYEAGQYIRFVPISEEEYGRIAEAVKAGTYIPVWHEED